MKGRRKVTPFPICCLPQLHRMNGFRHVHWSQKLHLRYWFPVVFSKAGNEAVKEGARTHPFPKGDQEDGGELEV